MNDPLLGPPSPLNEKALRVAPGADSGVRVVTPSAAHLARFARHEAEIRVVLAAVRSYLLLRGDLVESLARYHLVMIDCHGYPSSYAKQRFTALLESSSYRPSLFDLSDVYGAPF